MVTSYFRLLKVTVLTCVLLPILVAVCSHMVIDPTFSFRFFFKTAAALTIAAAVFVFFLKRLQHAQDEIGRHCQSLARSFDRIPPGRIDIAILVSAAVGLYLELAVIRWQGEVFPIFAFYKNYSLLACFAGLGLGYALARREAVLLPFSIPLLCIQFLLLMFLRHGMGPLRIEALSHTPFSEQLNMGVGVSLDAPYLIANYAFLTTVFLLTALAFIPIGQLCGRLMSKRQTLRAYGFNLLGSIAGVLVVEGLSFFWTPPVVWFSLCFAVLLYFERHHLRILFFNTAAALLGAVVLSWPVTPGIEALHTPYQMLEKGPGNYGLTQILAAGRYYQRVFDLSDSNANRSIDLFLRNTAAYYELPYRVASTRIERVAVVGAGMGNDVAAALRSGVRQVDAIEIDPGILKLGRMYHPEKPYDDSRVNRVVNDARTFLRTTDKSYDRIVYGLLDSHTLLSHASSVRLDSYVYTIQAFREARLHLTEKGVLSLSFCVLSDEMGRKLYLMMKEAFDGHAPICIRAGYDGSIIYLQARDGRLVVDPAFLKETGFEDVTDYYANPNIRADVSTDDWPFFYMPRRIYPVSYVGMMAGILLLSFLFMLNFAGQKLAFGNAVFFFLGAGFMLVETKAITELGLVFGNTWHVVGIVIAGILVMSFLANCAVQWLRPRRPTLWLFLLLCSLLAGFIVSRYGGLGSSGAGKIGSIALLTCPMFFSGIVFSTLLAQAADITGIMAVNMIGAMAGGVLEYNSMYFGFGFLYLLALVLYLVAMSLYLLRKPAGNR